MEFKIKDRTIYMRQSKRGWSIVVMPDNLLIDNFHHGYPHIHPQREKIAYDDPEIVFQIVTDHIQRENSINFEKLKKELIK